MKNKLTNTKNCLNCIYCINNIICYVDKHEITYREQAYSCKYYENKKNKEDD